MDAVERAEEKMATNEVPASAELKKKDCVRDLPMKPESRNMLGSSALYLFIKKALKGKGVISRRIEDPTESNITAGGQNNEKQVSVTTIASNAILNSSAKNDNSSQHNIDGISLREWLKLGCHEINKVERLLLFRKIVQLVDSAHSQGIVLLDLRPSYFILLPSSRVNYVGSSRLVHQRECSDMYQNINRKGH
ncbi:hypothetical protein HYC85_011067 [Camellia sinensis]|uniref:Protein kinase domain-containing protein n=1 Tax=Camellia sinensis TaxID=4442 RepID=A0A7J7HJU6_CAMSI|nr:hypothetical protein HYC85_011067 [Camellia sinensis]